jgi:predicted transcriptional regulator
MLMYRRRLLWLILLIVTFGSQSQPGLSRPARVWNLDSGRASQCRCWHRYGLPMLALRGGLHSGSTPTVELPGDTWLLEADRGRSALSDEDFVMKCTVAIDTDPDNARLYTARASALMRLDRLAEALRDAQQAKLLAQALSDRLQKLELKIVDMTQAGLSLKQRSGEFIKTIEEIRSDRNPCCMTGAYK